jgi:hypothetical protein
VGIFEQWQKENSFCVAYLIQATDKKAILHSYFKKAAKMHTKV